LLILRLTSRCQLNNSLKIIIDRCTWNSVIFDAKLYLMNKKLLAEICKTPGAPGHEDRVRKLVLREIESLCDSVEVDNMGNVYGIRRGKSDQSVMIGAHMDEIGFMVTYIDDKGFIRFTTLGGFDPKTLTAQRVIIHGKEDIIGVMASKPIHVMTQDERNKVAKLSDYFVDTGLPAEKVKELVSIGDVITREREFIEMGECFNSKSLDNRLAVFIAIEVLKVLKGKELPNDVYMVFTVQEEVGIRGANVASLNIKPKFGFGLDTTIAFDLPGAAAHEQITKLGEGTAIKIMDASTICDLRMVRYMKEVAERNKIKWQPEILTAGGTDTAGIQRMSPGGSIAGAVSIPTRHLHQVIEMAHKDDIQASIDLLASCLLELNQFKLEY
jgi:tetrahedral aminopeptidase